MILLVVVGSVVFELIKNSRVKKIASKPKKELKVNENELLWKLKNNQPISLTEIKNIKTFVDNRYDCSDFKLQSVLRMVYDYPDRLSTEMKNEIENMLVGFKYWMDEPGADGMCYWSENHQILFAAGEYLAGQLYPDVIFTNNGMSGVEHQEKARKRILTWLKQRWIYGFSEWYSNVYYVEDIAALSNLIDFASDQEIVIKSKIILDLLLYDLASQSFKGTFITSSGRLYEESKKSGRKASTRLISEALFGYDTDPGARHGMDLNFLYLKNYDVPQVIKHIGKDESTVVVKASNGLDLEELEKQNLIGTHDHQIMIQWGMEAFTNLQVISNSLKYIENNNLFNNSFLHDFTDINFTLLKIFNLFTLMSWILQPPTNGIAIQRANTYTYKTQNYSMYTAQNYHPGEHGDQQHIFGLNLDNSLSIFHTHPAIPADEKPPRGNSPTYWVGNGRLPHSMQHENINLSIYWLPDMPGIMEKKLIEYTHLYFPKDKFNRVHMEANRLYVDYQGTFIAFIGRNDFRYNEKHKEIIQEGRVTYWICELSHSGKESFENFISRIGKNTCLFKDKTLVYTSAGKRLSLIYRADFLVNERIVDCAYSRFDAPWIQAKRNPIDLTFKHDNHGLYLNFDNMIRKVF